MLEERELDAKKCYEIEWRIKWRSGAKMATECD